MTVVQVVVFAGLMANSMLLLALGAFEAGWANRFGWSGSWEDGGAAYFITIVLVLAIFAGTLHWRTTYVLPVVLLTSLLIAAWLFFVAVNPAWGVYALSGAAGLFVLAALLSGGGRNRGRRLRGVTFAIAVVTFANGLALVTVAAIAQPKHTDSLQALACTDAVSAVAVGDGGVVLLTQDGGITWAQRRSGVTHLSDVSFPTPQDGWSTGWGQVVFITRDRGQNWEKQRGPNQAGMALALSFADDKTGCLFGDHRSYRTLDGGVHWTRLDLPHVFIWDCELTSSQGWAVGEAGVVLTTRDAGLHWRRVTTPLQGDLWGVAFQGQRVVIVGSEGKIAASSDGGRSWNTAAHVTTSDLNAVSWPVGNWVWAVGRGGAVLRSSDAGRHWRVQDAPTNVDLNDVAFFDELHGWAVGGKGTILRTMDGGRSWHLAITATRWDW
jgi:photosystem II stability/assembly factor-like uncharacterized protein